MINSSLQGFIIVFHPTGRGFSVAISTALQGLVLGVVGKHVVPHNQLWHATPSVLFTAILNCVSQQINHWHGFLISW